ncbi:hypothetical protein BVC80_1559g13 [Macleaya cordata]|uniref:Uncharacterized protein n=1 Tax=Macleaya cordata TaxID=56857 RepID=A0A200QXZ8_MACCD|nr:hypothetical protein BVC80_1559g13 [Macleaya cordata]
MTEPPDGSSPPLSSHPRMIGLSNENRGIQATATSSDPISRAVGPASTPWVSLFASSNRLLPAAALSFIPPTVVDGQLTVSISSDDYKDQVRSCENFLIGTFVGRRLPYTFVKESLVKVWGLKGPPIGS